jgi:poly(3-hydroxyalkanoate) synthetase
MESKREIKSKVKLKGVERTHEAYHYSSNSTIKSNDSSSHYDSNNLDSDRIISKFRMMQQNEMIKGDNP